MYNGRMLYYLRVMLVVSLYACSLSAVAQAPFIYRGQLADSGQPASGNYDLRFGLANRPDPTRDPFLVVTNEAVLVSNGVFSVTLDFGLEAFDGSARWLDIGVRRHGATSEFTLLSPRQPLLAVPYALQAHVASRAGVATNLLDGGASLVTVPAESLTGNVPLRSISGITPQQMDPFTDALYRNPNTNAIRAIVRDTPPRGRVTPYEFGAKGDGIADDTAALQAWIDAAQSQNLIAELPPAITFYRITDSLLVRSFGGFTLIGSGGQSHITGGPYTRCRIHQVTPGKHGLVITNAVGHQTPTDNVFLQGFMVTAETYSETSYGIAFNGGTPDSDVDVIMNVATRNFGVGLFNGSGCNMSVISCSFSYCGDGIQINGPIVNSVLIQSTICTGNRSNGLHVVSAGNVTFDTGDIVTWHTDKAHLITIQSGLVNIRNMNGEHGSPVDAIRIWSPRANANVFLDAGVVIPYGQSPTNTYSLSVSNARSVTINGCQLNLRSSEGFPIIEFQSPPVTTSLRPFPQKVIVGNNIQTNWIGSHLRTFLPKLDGSSVSDFPHVGGLPHAGLLRVLNSPGDTELLFSAYLSPYNRLSTPVHVPLLQYAKDKLTTMTVSNLNVTGTLKTPGGRSGSLVNYPFMLSRLSYENGIITGTSYERWDSDALSFCGRAKIEDPIGIAAVDQLVKQLKSHDLWSLADAIYLFAGPTAETASLNLASTNYPITWNNLTPDRFTPHGLAGDGNGYGVIDFEVTDSTRFKPDNGSLFVYVQHPGSSPGFWAGTTTGNVGSYLGQIGNASGVFGSISGGATTNALATPVGPWVISRVNSLGGFLSGRTSTNVFSAVSTNTPSSKLGVLSAIDEADAPKSQTTATIRALWVGSGLTTGAAAALIKAFDEYVAILDTQSP